MNKPPQLHQRAAIQRAGLRRARAEMFEALAESISSGQCDPDIATVALLDRIAAAAFRAGIETEADALQAEFADMSLRIVDLEEHLSGLFQRQREASKS